MLLSNCNGVPCRVMQADTVQMLVSMGAQGADIAPPSGAAPGATAPEAHTRVVQWLVAHGVGVGQVSVHYAMLQWALKSR